MLTASVVVGTLLALVRLFAGWFGPGRHSAARVTAAVARLPRLRWWPLAIACVAGQGYLAFGAGLAWPGSLRAGAIVATQIGVLMVVVRNAAPPWRIAMAVIGAGLGLNLAVMLANQGLMPISPQTLVAAGNGHVLARPGVGAGTLLPRSKDVILPEDQTTLAWLADRIVLPGHHASYSAGDLLIAAGVFWAVQSAAGAALCGSAAAETAGACAALSPHSSAWSDAPLPL